MEDEWRLWQDTGLGFPVSHQMLDSSQCSESQARALCLSPVRPALPDDLYHPWDEPFDGLAAKETMQKLYDHYHKQVHAPFICSKSPNLASHSCTQS